MTEQSVITIVELLRLQHERERLEMDGAADDDRVLAIDRRRGVLQKALAEHDPLTWLLVQPTR